MIGACRCGERLRPLPADVPAGSNTRPRQWFVLRRNYTRSAFDGYRERWSERSDVACRVCGAHWRTKAGWVAALPDCEFFGDGRVAPRVEPIEG